MAEFGAYEDRMAAHLHLESAPVVTVEAERKAQLAITRLRSDAGLSRVSTRILSEKETETKIARGGLAPWQMRRATELLRDRLDGDVSLPELAAECKLSVSHFARSFKQAIGQTPHRWLVHRRVDAAKSLMLHSGMRLSEIALGCGFADQTSFNRAFKKIAGITPGDWRRSCRQ
jgi:AraC family transcriptional regulator